MYYANSRILVVEDDLNCSRLLYDLLSVHGYTIKSEKNGTDALKSILNERYDIIILDLRLPGENGFILAEQAKKSSINCDARIIVLSAYTDRQNKLRAYQAGVDAFLCKPVDTRELLYITNNFLHNTKNIKKIIYDAQYNINKIIEDYHGRSQHTTKVITLCQQIADLMNITNGDRDILLAAASLHDTGLLNPENPEGHEELSGRIAQALGASEKVVTIIKHHHYLEKSSKKQLDPGLVSLIEILQAAEKTEEVYSKSRSIFDDDLKKWLIKQPIASFIASKLA